MTTVEVSECVVHSGLEGIIRRERIIPPFQIQKEGIVHPYLQEIGTVEYLAKCAQYEKL